MKRLLSTLKSDIRLQARNGFYYAAAFIAVIFVVLLFGRDRTLLAWLLPFLMLNNLTVNAFYFISGVILLEKGEGTLEAQVVTPLRSGEYLMSKALSLTFLSLVESGFIILLTYGFEARWLLVISGVITMALMLALLGFIVVSRYDTINEFLFPSILITFPLSIPLLYYFGIVDHWLMLLHPLQAPLSLLQAAFQPAEPWTVVYGLVYSIFWIWVIYRLGQRSFYRFVILKQGVR